jgi:hypothetical protein
MTPLTGMLIAQSVEGAPVDAVHPIKKHMPRKETSSHEETSVQDDDWT